MAPSSLFLDPRPVFPPPLVARAHPNFRARFDACQRSSRSAFRHWRRRGDGSPSAGAKRLCSVSVFRFAWSVTAAVVHGVLRSRRPANTLWNTPRRTVALSHNGYVEKRGVVVIPRGWKNNHNLAMLQTTCPGAISLLPLFRETPRANLNAR